MSSSNKTPAPKPVNELLESLSENNDRSTKLGRRRLIEELEEQRLLEEEFFDYEIG